MTGAHELGRPCCRAGNGIVSYYFAKILNTIGITSPDQQAGINGGLQIWNWVIAMAAALATERLGRRVLYLGGGLGMLVCFVGVTICSAIYAQKGNAGVGYAVSDNRALHWTTGTTNDLDRRIASLDDRTFVPLQRILCCRHHWRLLGLRERDLAILPSKQGERYFFGHASCGFVL